MAVQAQYPANAFSPDCRVRAPPRNNVMEDLQALQDHNLNGAYAHLVNNGGGTTVLSNPQSGLTCNATSGSRKRTREQQSTMNPLPIQIPMATPTETTVNNNSNYQSRLLASAGTSTSGRTPVGSSSLAQGLLSNLYQQNLEIDALVRLQNERLRSGLDEARKRHCKALLTAVEQGIVKRLQEKDAEIEITRRRNIELEEKLKQMAAENQIWFNVAKNNEAIATSLRATLEQVLLQNNAGARASHPEGFGDSDAGAADDAESCCFELGSKEEDDEMRSRRACKVCRERDVSVLLLPCRHLCLCKECESKVDTCPVCCSAKNACLEIFMA